MDDETLRARFDRVYGKLARDGAADAVGSREYERLLARWIGIGRPAPVHFFLIAELAAGARPTGPGGRVENGE